MVWVRNDNGSFEYKASKIYFKSILPTNAEFIKFINDRSYTFQSSKDTEMDRFWKVPHQKYLMAICCNQLNKIIYEDNHDSAALEYLSSSHVMKCVAMAFILITHDNYESDTFEMSEYLSYLEGSMPPPTYFITKMFDDPFTSISTHEKIDITDSSEWGHFDLALITQYKNNESAKYDISISCNTDELNVVMNKLLESN